MFFWMFLFGNFVVFVMVGVVEFGVGVGGLIFVGLFVGNEIKIRVKIGINCNVSYF